MTSVSLFASATRAPLPSAARTAGSAVMPVRGDHDDLRIGQAGQLLQAAGGPAPGAAARAVSLPVPRARASAAAARARSAEACPAARPTHPEPVGMRGDDLERLATDRAGRAEDADPDHVPAPATSRA